MEEKTPQKNKVTLIYEDNANPYAHNVELTFSVDEPTGADLQGFFRAFMHALGYTEKTIDDCLGEEIEPEI